MVALSNVRKGKAARKEGNFRQGPAASKKAAEDLRKFRIARRRKSPIAFASDWKVKGYAKRLVWLGKKKTTSSGLTSKNLMENKRGKIVSKRKNALGKKAFVTNKLDLWLASVLRARQEMRCKGFVKLKSSSKGGVGTQSELHRRAKEHLAVRLLRLVSKNVDSRKSLSTKLEDQVKEECIKQEKFV